MLWVVIWRWIPHATVLSHSNLWMEAGRGKEGWIGWGGTVIGERVVFV